jgi:hypothetical protein
VAATSSKLWGGLVAAFAGREFLYIFFKGGNGQSGFCGARRVALLRLPVHGGTCIMPGVISSIGWSKRDT